MIYSRDKVDRRMLKLHKMAKQPPTRRTSLLDLLEYLGVSEHIRGVFQSSSSSESDKKSDLLSDGSIKEENCNELNAFSDQESVKEEVEMANKP